MSLTEKLDKPEYQPGLFSEQLASFKSKAASPLSHLKTGNLKTAGARTVDGPWQDK
jgi:hypothetical protein